MQIQKHLFRIYERATRPAWAYSFWSTTFNCLLILAITFGVIFIVGSAFVLTNNNKLSKCLTKTALQINNDSLYEVRYQKQITVQNLPYLYKANLIGDNSQCTIIENKHIIDRDILSVVFGYDEVAMFMKTEIRKKMNYTTFTIYLKQVNFLISWLYKLDNLIVNEIIQNSDQIFLHQRIYIISQSGFVVHSQKNLNLVDKAKLLAQVIFFYALISISTSLYIFGTIAAAPAVILFLLKICNLIHEQGRNTIFKLFPWIGIHVLVRNTSANPIIKKSFLQICKSMICYFLFLYLIYYASIVWISKGLPSLHMVHGLQELLFGTMALFQFSAIVFMRSQSFIKYFPTCHSLLIIALLYYWEINNFGFKKIALYWIFSISAALFVWMIIKFELHSFINQGHLRTDTPKYRRAYFPIFNMEWIKNMPQEWTLMMPLFGKENFTISELSLVENNMNELGLRLGNL